MRALARGRARRAGRRRTGDPRGRCDASTRTRSTRRSRPRRSCCRARALIADRMEVVDPDAIHAARERLRAAIGSALRGELSCGASQRRRCGRRSVARRPRASGGLRTVALGFIAAGDRARGRRARQGAVRPRRQHDRPAGRARRAGVAGRAGARGGARCLLSSASTTIRWCSTNGSRSRRRRSAPTRVDQVLKLAEHPDFTIANPNRLRSLVGTFGANQWAFHRRDGRGYAFLADMIIAADKLNPQIAARMVPPLGRWRRFEPKRAAMMRDALERIAATPGLSKDVVRAGLRRASPDGACGRTSNPAVDCASLTLLAMTVKILPPIHLRDLAARPGWRRG